MNYPVIDPYKGLASSIATGVQMGSMIRKPEPNLIEEPLINQAKIPDPGKYQPIPIDAVLTNEKQDFTNYAAAQANIKKHGGKELDEIRQKELMAGYVNTGAFKTKFGQAVAKSGLPADEVSKSIKAIKGGDPLAWGNLGVMISKAENSEELQQVFDEKMAEYKALEDKYKADRKIPLETAILGGINVMDNPKPFLDKNNQLNPETKSVVDNYNAYLQEYIRNYGIEAGKELLGKIEAQKQYKPETNEYNFLYKDEELGRWIDKQATASGIPELEARFGADKVRNVTNLGGSIGPSIYKKGQVEDIEEQKKLIRALPKPKRKGQKIDTPTKQLYLNAYRDKEIAKQKILNDNWTF